MTTQPAQDHLVAAISESLKAVKYPPYSRDIVSFGLVKQIVVRDGLAFVELEAGSAGPEAAFQIQADAERAIRALPQLKGVQVKVELTTAPETRRRQPADGHEPLLSPLQDEVQQAGRVSYPDPLIESTIRPDLAPSAGYGEDGPPPLGGPADDWRSTKWQGPTPVFQWEIDPVEPETQEYGEAEVERRGWLFRMWWQIHPAGLVYAAISAVCEEEEERPAARQHPIGRNVAVNLVYDLQREGMAAIYGTALDFRPFVEVFLEGFFSRQADEQGVRSAPNSELRTPNSETRQSLRTSPAADLRETKS